jgi:hypothetical protein
VKISKESSSLLDEVFAELDLQEIRWSVLRGAADLENLERDVDLLVASQDLVNFEEVVIRLGGAPLPKSLHGWHRFYWFRRGRLADPGLTLDVVSTLKYGRGGQVATDLAPGCLERRVRAGSRYELAPTDSFWTVMLHCLLDKGEVKERRAHELEEALPSLMRPSDGEAAVAALCPEGWSADRLIESVRRGDWQSINGLAASLSSQTSDASGQPNLETGRKSSGILRGVKRRLPGRNSIAGNLAKTAYSMGWKLARRGRAKGHGGPER